MGNIKYNLKRNRDILKPTSLLLFSIMFLLIFLVSTIQNNFADEYIRIIKNKYPMDAFNINAKLAESYKSIGGMKIYERYELLENDIFGCYLSDEDDSVLSIDDMLEYGSFPQNGNEVIISRELAERLYGKKADYDKCIGKSFSFCEREFTVAGILYYLDDKKRGPKANDNFTDYLESDIYYLHIPHEAIFIPYDTIKNMGGRVNGEFLRCSYKGLFDNPDMVERVRDMSMDGVINIFDREVTDSRKMLDEIYKILTAVLILCFVISCIFMYSNIRLELFYRRREIGYLQIFGLEKDRVKRMIMTGYNLKIGFSFAASLLIYFLIIFSYGIFSGGILFFNLKHIAYILIVIFTFYGASTYISVCRFLGNKVIRLITDN